MRKPFFKIRVIFEYLIHCDNIRITMRQYIYKVDQKFEDGQLF